MGQTENKVNHKRIQVVIFAKYVIDLDNGSGHLVRNVETNFKII